MQVYQSNSTGAFIILEQSGQKCVIQFIETGTIKTANKSNIDAGKVKDPYYCTVYGVGYYGIFEKVPYWKQAKQLWQNMLKRCYCEKDQKGYFGKVTVDTRWHCFANFLNDLPRLENFDMWLKGQKQEGIKFNLDKDFKFPGNTVYSALACSFISESENKAAGARNGKPFTKIKRI